MKTVSHPIADNSSVDFDPHIHDKELRPLERLYPPVSELSTGLKDYISLLNSSSSLALIRGENMESVRLGEFLGRLF